MTGCMECSRALPHVFCTTSLPAWPQNALVAMASLKSISNAGNTTKAGKQATFTNCLKRRQWKNPRMPEIQLHSSRVFGHIPYSEALHVHHHSTSRSGCGSSRCFFGHVRSHRPMPWWCAMESHHMAFLVECCGKSKCSI